MNNEQYIAGAILIDGAQVLPAIRGILPAGAFQYDEYRAIYTAGLSLLDAGEPVGPVSIRTQAKRRGVELSEKLIVELMEVVPTAAYCVDYAHRVAEDARTRAIKELAAHEFKMTLLPPLMSFYRPSRGRRRPYGAAATSGGY